MSRVLIVSSDRSGPQGLAINLGDCLLSDALADRVRAAGHAVEVADFGSMPRADGSRVMLAGLGDLARAVRTADLVLVGGGTMLQDDTPEKRLGGLPRLCLAVALVAVIARVPVAYIAVGCDPVKRWGQRLALTTAVRVAKEVWVRDARSQARVREMLHRRAELGADAALLLRTRDAGLTHNPRERSGCVIALNRVDAAKLDATVVSALGRRHGGVTFLSMDQGENADSESLTPEAAKAFDTLTSNLTVDDAIGVIASARMVIASRMHALYIAALTETPMTAIGRATKVAAFADEFLIPVADEVSEQAAGTLADSDVLGDAVSRAEYSVGAVVAGLESKFKSDR
ncbi:polysaccharide pyruvyl transferase family protein [Jatrophihabitans sp. YIM 134969]